MQGVNYEGYTQQVKHDNGTDSSFHRTYILLNLIISQILTDFLTLSVAIHNKVVFKNPTP